MRHEDLLGKNCAIARTGAPSLIVIDAVGLTPRELAHMPRLRRLAADGFKVVSGDDAFTFPLMALGGVGVISVVSNEIPGEITKFVHLLLDGKYDEARKINARLLPLFQANFIETNPIPVKAALAMMGKIKEVYRLPMCAMNPENRAKLEKVLVEHGLLQSQEA